jgi:hypothetical protein
MKENPSPLGYGRTPYPDTDGASALEGLVAAIEARCFGCYVSHRYVAY